MLLSRLFSIELRVLGVFRVLLGALLLVDVARRLPLLSLFLGSDGVLPDASATPPGLHQLVPYIIHEWVLVGAVLLSSVALMLGWFTRLCGPISWLLLLTLQRRNPWILDAGDSILLQLHLWGLLLPWGDRLSMDARRAARDGAAGAQPPSAVLSFASAGLLLHGPVVYFFSALHKLKTPTWRDGSAVADAVGQTLWARPLGTWIAQHSTVSEVITYATLAIELIAPLLLFLPWFTEAARRWTLLTLVLFQAGIAVSLRMNLFPFIMTLALVPHMTQSVWSRLTWKRTSATHTPKASFRHNHTVSLLAQYMGAALLSFFLLSNLASVTARIGFPAGLTFMESSLGLHQGWSMYAPPITQDMGLRITIELSNGKTVELEDGRRLLNRGRVQTGFPPLNPIWRDYRGGMYMESLSYSAGRGELSAFASWVKTRWEELHPGAPTVQKVRLERVEWSRQTPADLSTELLLEWQSPHPP